MPGKNLKWLFYTLVVYTILAFVWWGYLIWDKNDEAYHLAVENARLEYLLSGETNTDIFYESEQYSQLSSRHKRQRLMIAGEGIVLFVLLILGIWRLKTTLFREVEMARRQKNFLMSVTHELKSPLASIKLGLETLSRLIKGEEKEQKLIQSNLKESDRLASLIDNILLTARLDNKAFNPEIEKVEINSLFKQIVTNLSEQYRYSHDVELSADSVLVFYTDKQILISVVTNILENAHKYADKGSEILLKVFQKNEALHIEISDRGQGIPDVEKKKIFEKFYRVGNENTRKAKGTGLGLFLVKEMLKLLNGQIKVEDNSEGGTTFKVVIPGKFANIADSNKEELKNKQLDYEAQNSNSRG
ncbi:MAG: GHKL domain-containing protein [Chitinophagaceae bacterium]|nr:MAG: GHKL domain-containing protein [Chitinophagaceae bacterium]